MHALGVFWVFICLVVPNQLISYCFYPTRVPSTFLNGACILFNYNIPNRKVFLKFNCCTISYNQNTFSINEVSQNENLMFRVRCSWSCGRCFINLMLRVRCSWSCGKCFINRPSLCFNFSLNLKGLHHYEEDLAKVILKCLTREHPIHQLYY